MLEAEDIQKTHPGGRRRVGQRERARGGRDCALESQRKEHAKRSAHGLKTRRDALTKPERDHARALRTHPRQTTRPRGGGSPRWPLHGLQCPLASPGLQRSAGQRDAHDLRELRPHLSTTLMLTLPGRAKVAGPPRKRQPEGAPPRRGLLPLVPGLLITSILTQSSEIIVYMTAPRGAIPGPAAYAAMLESPAARGLADLRDVSGRPQITSRNTTACLAALEYALEEYLPPGPG